MHKPRLLWAGLLLEKKLFWCTMIVRMDISYIRVAAGTKNTLKLGAISNAFYKAGLFIEMEGHDVPSDVPKQPFTRSEVREGARARAMRAMEANTGAQLGIGIETGIICDGHGPRLPGLTSDGDAHFEIACCIIVDRNLRLVGEGWSAAIETPKKVIALMMNENLKSYMAVARLTGKSDADTIHYYTGGRTDRETVLSDAVFLALARVYLNPEAYQ